MQSIVNRVKIGRRNLAALYAFTATSRLWFDGGLWVVYFQHQGLSLFDIGLLEALLHVVCLISDVPVGAFADRFGWRMSLACGTVLGVVYTAIALVATNPWLIALAFAARGLQITLTNGSNSSMAYESAKWAELTHRYQAIAGRLTAIGLVSMGVAEALGGTLAHFSWSLVYVAFTAANAVSLITVLCMKEPREGGRGLTDPTDAVHPSVISILRDACQFARRSRRFVKWIVLSGILYGFVATFAFYGQARLLGAGWTLVGIGILTGIENFVGALAALVSEKLTKRMGERRAMATAGGLASAGLLLFAWTPGLSSGAGYLVSSMAANFAEPMIDQGLNAVVPSSQRATLLSVNSTAFSLFMILCFPLFGAVANHIGLTTAFHAVSIAAVICILASVLWWSLGRGSGDITGAEVTSSHSQPG
jgi:MFS family permease